MTVVEGDEATLHCHVSGQPRPRVRWRRPELGTRPVLEAAPGGGFLVREAVVRDSGVYTCTAENRFGQEATCNTSLIVIGKLNINASQVKPTHLVQQYPEHLVFFLAADPPVVSVQEVWRVTGS